MNQPDDAIPSHAWGALFVSTIVVFFAVVNLSSVNVAFPSIREDLGSTDTELSWIIAAYNLALSAFLLASGRLADSLGRKRVYLPGVAIFGLGSILCALAPTTLTLVAARVVQGLGGSIVIAAGFAVMLPEFPPTRRSTPIGIAGAAGGLGAVVGPVVGSFVIDLFSWRAIFWLNVPLVLLVLIIGPKLLNESSDPNATGNIDWLGVVIGTVGVGSIVFAITQTDAWGIIDPRVIGIATLGVALSVLLIIRSRTHDEPLIDTELFQHRSFTSANIGAALYGLAFASGPLVSSLLLQDVWNLPVRDVGLAFAPGPLLAAVTSPIAGRWADRIGHRWLLASGCGLLALSNLLFILAFDETPALWNQYVPISLVGGLGVGLSIATWSSAAVADISPARFGIAGATFNTLRQSTLALGVAVVVALIAATGDSIGIAGVQRAYGFVLVCFFAAGLTVAVTFPKGSARDRATAHN